MYTKKTTTYHTKCSHILTFICEIPIYNILGLVWMILRNAFQEPANTTMYYWLCLLNVSFKYYTTI